MAPKAKAKVGAKAKARPGILARPAAVVRRRGDRARAGDGARMRRPAAAHVGTPWGSGVVMKFAEVNLEDLTTEQIVVVSSGIYFGATVKVAGRLQRVEVSGGQKHAWMVLTGTDHEGVLRMCTSQPQTPFQLHLCQDGCGYHESGDRYIHAIQGRKVLDETKEDDWVFNLRGVKPVEVSPRGRVGRTSSPRRGGRPYGSGGGSRRQEGRGEFLFKQEEEEKEGKEEEKEEERGGPGRREKAPDQLPENPQEFVRGYRVRPFRQSEKKGFEESKKLCEPVFKEKGFQQYQLKWQREPEPIPGRRAVRRVVCGDQQGKSNCRTVPRSIDPPSQVGDAGKFARRNGGGSPAGDEPARGYALLSGPTTTESRRSSKPRTNDSLQCPRPPPEGQSGPSSRCADSESQELRNRPGRIALVDRPTPRSTDPRECHGSPTCGSGQCTTRVIPRVKDSLLGIRGRKGDEKGKHKGKGGKNRDGDYGKDGGKKGDHGDGDHREKKKQK